MAGGVMAFVNCPVELLKVKLQTQYSPAVGVAPIAGAIKPVSRINPLSSRLVSSSVILLRFVSNGSIRHFYFV